jgi:hypothetical protein
MRIVNTIIMEWLKISWWSIICSIAPVVFFFFACMVRILLCCKSFFIYASFSVATGTVHASDVFSDVSRFDCCEWKRLSVVIMFYFLRCNMINMYLCDRRGVIATAYSWTAEVQIGRFTLFAVWQNAWQIEQFTTQQWQTLAKWCFTVHEGNTLLCWIF